MTENKTNKADRIGEALTRKGLHNNEHNRAEVIAKVQEVGESVQSLERLQIERSTKERGAFWVWLYFRNEKGNLYDKQGGRAFSLYLEEMTTRQRIEAAINSKEWKNEHAKKHLTANGWKCEKVENNKPATLQELAETLRLCNYLFYFLFVEDNESQHRAYYRLTGWDESGKRAAPARCPAWVWSFNSPYNLKDANTARVKASKVYLLKAPKTEGETMQAKANARRQNWHKVGNTCEIIPTERRNLEDVHISWRFTGFSGEGWKVYSIDNIFVADSLTTRDNEQQAKAEAIALIYDKSGYRRGERIAELKRQAKANNARRLAAEWESTNKEKYVKQLETIEEAIIADFQKVANSGAFDFYTLHRLQDLGECVREVQKVKEHINNYKSALIFADDLDRCERLAKKCHILAPLHADPLAYGFSWWHLRQDGTLAQNRDNLDRNYYATISAQSVGTVAE
jgi:hypothetical protein